MTQPIEWQLQCSELKQRGAYLFKTKIWSDISFEFGTENKIYIKAHKLIMAMASPVFGRMFYGGAYKNPVPISDIPPDSFNILLEYIYSDNINIKSFSTACDLYNAAIKCRVPHVAKECARYISRNLGASDVCRIYEMDSWSEDSPLRDACIEFFIAHTKEILEDASFLQADMNTVLKIFSLENLNIDNELDLFQATVRYAYARDKKADVNANDDDLFEEDNRNEEPSPPKRPRRDSTAAADISQSYSAQCMNTENGDPELFCTASDAGDKTLELYEYVREDRDKLQYRDMVQLIRFLTLSPLEFAECPHLLHLLTERDTLALGMNISSRDTRVRMPEGFSTSMVPRNLSTKQDRERLMGTFHSTVPNFKSFKKYRSTAFYIRNLPWTVLLVHETSDALVIAVTCFFDNDVPEWILTVKVKVKFYNYRPHEKKLRRLSVILSAYGEPNPEYCTWAAKVKWSDITNTDYNLINNNTVTYTAYVVTNDTKNNPPSSAVTENFVMPSTRPSLVMSIPLTKKNRTCLKMHDCLDTSLNSEGDRPQTPYHSMRLPVRRDSESLSTQRVQEIAPSQSQSSASNAIVQTSASARTSATTSMSAPQLPSMPDINVQSSAIAINTTAQTSAAVSKAIARTIATTSKSSPQLPSMPDINVQSSAIAMNTTAQTSAAASKAIARTIATTPKSAPQLPSMPYINVQYSAIAMNTTAQTSAAASKAIARTIATTPKSAPQLPSMPDINVQSSAIAINTTAQTSAAISKAIARSIDRAIIPLNVIANAMTPKPFRQSLSVPDNAQPSVTPLKYVSQPSMPGLTSAANFKANAKASSMTSNTIPQSSVSPQTPFSQPPMKGFTSAANFMPITSPPAATFRAIAPPAKTSNNIAKSSVTPITPFSQPSMPRNNNTQTSASTLKAIASAPRVQLPSAITVKAIASPPAATLKDIASPSATTVKAIASPPAITVKDIASPPAITVKVIASPSTISSEALPSAMTESVSVIAQASSIAQLSAKTGRNRSELLALATQYLRQATSITQMSANDLQMAFSIKYAHYVTYKAKLATMDEETRYFMTAVALLMFAKRIEKARSERHSPTMLEMDDWPISPMTFFDLHTPATESKIGGTINTNATLPIKNTNILTSAQDFRPIAHAPRVGDAKLASTLAGDASVPTTKKNNIALPARNEHVQTFSLAANTNVTAHDNKPIVKSSIDRNANVLKTTVTAGRHARQLSVTINDVPTPNLDERVDDMKKNTSPFTANNGQPSLDTVNEIHDPTDSLFSMLQDINTTLGKIQRKYNSDDFENNPQPKIRATKIKKIRTPSKQYSSAKLYSILKDINIKSILIQRKYNAGVFKDIPNPKLRVPKRNFHLWRGSVKDTRTDPPGQSASMQTDKLYSMIKDINNTIIKITKKGNSATFKAKANPKNLPSKDKARLILRTIKNSLPHRMSTSLAPIPQIPNPLGIKDNPAGIPETIKPAKLTSLPTFDISTDNSVISMVDSERSVANSSTLIEIARSEVVDCLRHSCLDSPIISPDTSIMRDNLHEDTPLILKDIACKEKIKGFDTGVSSSPSNDCPPLDSVVKDIECPVYNPATLKDISRTEVADCIRLSGFSLPALKLTKPFETGLSSSASNDYPPLDSVVKDIECSVYNPAALKDISRTVIADCIGLSGFSLPDLKLSVQSTASSNFESSMEFLTVSSFNPLTLKDVSRHKVVVSLTDTDY